MDRKTIIERAINECVNELYLAAQPSISLEDLKKNYANLEAWYNRFYLSQQEADEIIENYIQAYRIRNEFHEDVDIVRSYLRDGGTKDKYIEPTVTSPGYRGYEKTPKLSDLIGDESTKMVLGLIDECDNFYKCNREESGFKFNVLNYAPCCNIEKVRENNPYITIYERRYDEEWDKWRNVDENGKFIYESEELE